MGRNWKPKHASYCPKCLWVGKRAGLGSCPECIPGVPVRRLQSLLDQQQELREALPDPDKLERLAFWLNSFMGGTPIEKQGNLEATVSGRLLVWARKARRALGEKEGDNR